MPQTMTVQTANQELLHDHERIDGLAEQVRRARDLEHVRSALVELHEAMKAHFLCEEKPGGLYDTLGVCVPALRRPLAWLVDDHFRLTATAHDLRARASEPQGSELEMLQKDVARLAAALAEHEQRERQMVEDALGREEETD